MTERLLVGRSKLSDRLYNDMLNSILIGDFPPHTRLPPEERIAHDYGVSRATVRSALGRLKSEGFVASRQGSGTTVNEARDDAASRMAPLESLADLEKFYECRIAIESETAFLAAQRRSPEDIAFMESHIITMRELTTSGAVQTSEDAEFHVRLVGMADNQFFESIMDSIRPHLLFGMNVSKTLPTPSRRKHEAYALKEHEHVVAAVIAQDAEGARQCMRHHLEQSRKRLFGGR